MADSPQGDEPIGKAESAAVEAPQALDVTAESPILRPSDEREES